MVYILKKSTMSDEEIALALSLQGIMNRKKKCIYIDVDRYLDYLEDSDIVPSNIYNLLSLFADEFKAVALYHLSSDDVGILMGAMISASDDILAVPDQLWERLPFLLSKPLTDLRKIKGTNAERQKIIFDQVFDSLNKNALVHQVVSPNNFHLTIYDFAIERRIASIYTSESREDQTFRKYVLSKLNKCIPVYGWNDDEISFIKDISEYGDYAIPSDWSSNQSYFKDEGELLHQMRLMKAPRLNKHYVAIVVSDGDNVQWLERDFGEKGGMYSERVNHEESYKLNWTFSPSLRELCFPSVMSIMNEAKYDYFVSGVSGIGYANCLSFQKDYLDLFTKKTAQGMKNSDLEIVTLLDSLRMMKDPEFVRSRLHSYARFDIIKGGIWELDPDRYGSGQGCIFWSDGKPFVSVRFTLWYPTGKMEDVSKTWLDEMAEEVNKMPISPDKAEGYSIINVHPWTIDMSSLNYFVSCLNKDKVEIVYADELIDLIKKNMSHKE